MSVIIGSYTENVATHLLYILLPRVVCVAQLAQGTISTTQDYGLYLDINNSNNNCNGYENTNLNKDKFTVQINFSMDVGISGQ